MNPVALLVVFVAIDVCATWAAGYALAMEDWVGGQRTRFEGWAYRSPDLVHSEEPADMLESYLLWDRAEPWALFRKRARPVPEDRPQVTVTSASPPTITVSSGRGEQVTPGYLLPRRVKRWTYRGVPGMSTAMPGRRVPTRRVKFPQMTYAVPTVNGIPLGRADRAATILRCKLADLWGCPKCSGMWGGAVLALILSHFGPWGYGWLFVAALHVAAWGVARRIGWSE